MLPSEALRPKFARRSRPPWSSSSWPLLLLASLISACDAPPLTNPPSAETSRQVELVHGKALQAELDVETPDNYLLHLEAGDFVEIIVDQTGVDVVAELFPPAEEGAKRPSYLRVDNLMSKARPEHILWVAEESGAHRLEISAFKASTGTYEIEWREYRPASVRDRKNVQAEALFSQAEILRRKGRDADKEAAVRLYREAIAIWGDLEETARESDAYYRIGIVHGHENSEDAIHAFAKALRMFEDIGDVRKAAEASHWLGHIYLRRRNLQLARELNHRTLRLRERDGDGRGKARTHHNTARTYGLLGEVQKALDHYQEALDYWQGQDNPSDESLTLHNLGKSYLRLGLEAEALDRLQKALAIRQDLGDPARQASTLMAIGQAYGSMGESNRAIETLQRAIELYRQAGSTRGRALAITELAMTRHRLGRSEETVDLLLQAIAIFQQLGERVHEANTHMLTGWVRNDLGQPDAALESYRACLPRFENTKNRPRRITTLHGMALAERQRGNLETARLHLETALDEVERLRLKPASYSLQYSYFATKHNYYEDYVDLLMEMHQQNPLAGHDREALHANERSRARSQLDVLRDSEADLGRDVDQELTDREHILEEKIESLELRRMRLLETAADPALVADVERQLRDLFLDHGRIQGKIRNANPRYAALTRPQPLSTAEIQDRVLEDGALLLEYALGDERSYLWAVSRHDVRSFELAPRAVIEKAAKRAYKLLSSDRVTASRKQTQLALEKLGELLLAPIAPLLDGQRLLVVTDEALQYIPFGALASPSSTPPGRRPRDSDGAQLLSQQHEIINLPSASTLAVLREQLADRPRPRRTLAVLADAVFSAEDPRFSEAESKPPSTATARGSQTPEHRTYERLVFSRQEADAILALLPDSSTSAAIGFAADRKAVLEGGLSDYRYLHFATHGELNTTRPELSRLVTSQFDTAKQPIDGYVFAHEIYGLQLAADLVVLSACETALGADIRGEGLLGLTQSFLYAGAASVIVSLWNVDDQATAELMARFYRGMFEDNLRPAAALRNAQQSIRSETRWRDPYFWAAFVIQGEWR